MKGFETVTTQKFHKMECSLLEGCFFLFLFFVMTNCSLLGFDFVKKTPHEN